MGLAPDILTLWHFQKITGCNLDSFPTVANYSSCSLFAVVTQKSGSLARNSNFTGISGRRLV
jgi:hypothetical protein